MADPTPLTVTCDSLDEFDDDATGFVAEDLPAGAADPNGFPRPGTLAAAKALWVNAIRQWATPSVGAPHRFAPCEAESAGFQVTVRVPESPGAVTTPSQITLQATAIDVSSDQFITLIEGSHARAIVWTDIAHIAIMPTAAASTGPAAAG